MSLRSRNNHVRSWCAEQHVDRMTRDNDAPPQPYSHSERSRGSLPGVVYRNNSPSTLLDQRERRKHRSIARWLIPLVIGAFLVLGGGFYASSWWSDRPCQGCRVRAPVVAAIERDPSLAALDGASRSRFGPTSPDAARCGDSGLTTEFWRVFRRPDQNLDALLADLIARAQQSGWKPDANTAPLDGSAWSAHRQLAGTTVTQSMQRNAASIGIYISAPCTE